MLITRRNRNLILASAFLPIIAAMHLTDGGAAGGGGGSETEEQRKEREKREREDRERNAKRIELTQEELDAQKQAAVDAALKKERDDAAAAKKKSDDEAAAEKAKRDGDYQKLADAEKAKREEAEAKLASIEHRQSIDHAIAKAAKDHPSYPLDVFNEYVAPKLVTSIKVGADVNAIDKTAKDAVKAYVDANPRAGGAGGPGQPGNNNRQQPRKEGGGGGQKVPQNPSEVVGGYMNRTYRGPARFRQSDNGSN